MIYQRFLLPAVLLGTTVVFIWLFPVAAAPECALASGRPYRADNSRTVYYVTDACTKQPIKNPDVFFSHYTSWSDVSVTSETNLDAVPDDALGFVPWGSRRIFDSGSVIKTVNNNRVYVVLNKTQVYPIGSEEVFGNLRLEWSWVEDVVPEVITAYSMQSIITSTSAYPTGFTFTYSNAPDVFTIVDDGGVGSAKRYIRDMDTLRSQYRLDRIAVFPTSRVIRDAAQQDNRGSDPATSTPPGTGNTVQTVSALRSAIRNATPGTTITLAPGTYDLAGTRIATTRGGTAQAPITIRGTSARSVIVQTNGAEEAFQVSHPYYAFDNLTIEVGGQGSYHAYKIDTDGHDIAIRHNVLVVRRGGDQGIREWRATIS